MSTPAPEWEDRLIRLLFSQSHDDPHALHRKLARLVDILEAEEKTRNQVRQTVMPKENGAHRRDHEVIERHVTEGASVLDLGCGAGTLLARLMKTRRVRGQGIELDSEMVLECVANGVPVFQADLDQGLAEFPDQSFDFVVLEETVQTLHKPITVLTEMVRVGRQGIVTFPNFGHWQVRLDLAINGRMPITQAWPYEWYESPNIRPLALQDFEDCVHQLGIRVVDGHVLSEQDIRPLGPDDNLFAEEVMLVIEKE